MRKLINTLLSICLVFGPSLPSWGDEMGPLAKYEWRAHPGRAYYLLVITSRDGSYFIRTGETKVHLRGNLIVRVLAFDSHMNILDRPSITKTPEAIFAGTTTKPAASEVNETPNDKGTEEVAAEPSPAQEAPLTPEEQDEVKAVEKLTDEEKTAFDDAPYRHISATLDLGTEAISATGGVSSFKGSTGFGGASAALDIIVDDNPSQDLKWTAVNADLHYHTFDADQKVVAQDTGSSYVQPISIGRTSAKLAAQHRLWHYATFSVSSLLGFGLYQTALMTTSNTVNGSAGLTTVLLISPLLGLRFGKAFSQSLNMGLQFEMLPLVLENGKSGSRWTVGLDSSYYILPFLFSKISVQHTQESTHQNLSCPAGITGCSKSATSSISGTSFNLGLGFFF